MKVKLSFGHKTVILSLSKLNIESKHFFYKTCSVCYAIWDYQVKSESEAVISSQSNHFVTQNWFPLNWPLPSLKYVPNGPSLFPGSEEWTWSGNW